MMPETITIHQLRGLTTPDLRALGGPVAVIVPWIGETPVAVILPYTQYVEMQQMLEAAQLCLANHPIAVEIADAAERLKNTGGG